MPFMKSLGRLRRLPGTDQKRPCLFTDRIALRETRKIHLPVSVRDGSKDARAERAPFRLITDPAKRREVLLTSWKSVGKVFVMVALILDPVNPNEPSDFIEGALSR